MKKPEEWTYSPLIVLLSGRLAVGAIIYAGDCTILQAANQTVIVTVSGESDTALALDFYASVANGPGGSTALEFTELDFTDPGYMWNGSDFENPWSGSATSAQGGAGDFPVTPPMPWQGPISVPGTPASPANLVEVTFDASSAPLGTWDFLLTGDGPTSFTGGTAGTTQIAGTITVNAIPEPGTLVALVGLAGMGGLGLWFQRRKRRAG